MQTPESRFWGGVYTVTHDTTEATEQLSHKCLKDCHCPHTERDRGLQLPEHTHHPEICLFIKDWVGLYTVCRSGWMHLRVSSSGLHTLHEMIYLTFRYCTRDAQRQDLHTWPPIPTTNLAIHMDIWILRQGLVQRYCTTMPIIPSQATLAFRKCMCSVLSKLVLTYSKPNRIFKESEILKEWFLPIYLFLFM